MFPPLRSGELSARSDPSSPLFCCSKFPALRAPFGSPHSEAACFSFYEGNLHSRRLRSTPLSSRTSTCMHSCRFHSSMCMHRGDGHVLLVHQASSFTAQLVQGSLASTRRWLGVSAGRVGGETLAHVRGAWARDRVREPHDRRLGATRAVG